MADANPLAIPNLLTYARIAVIPVIAVLMAFGSPLAAWFAFGFFLAAAITDYLDGLAARMLNQYSDLGRMLDPIADKLIVATVIVMLVAQDAIAGYSLIPALVILARELLVSGLREYLGPKNVVIHVSRLAKWKTTVQLAALALLILVPALPPIAMIGLLALWIAGGLTAFTGYEYVRQGLSHLLSGGEPGKAETS